MPDGIVRRITERKAQAWGHLVDQLRAIRDAHVAEAERLLGPNRGE